MDSNFKEFIRVVSQMRRYQVQFHREKRKDALPISISYEKKVDEMLRAFKMLEEHQKATAGHQVTMELRQGPGGTL